MYEKMKCRCFGACYSLVCHYSVAFRWTFADLVLGIALYMGSDCAAAALLRPPSSRLHGEARDGCFRGCMGGWWSRAT